MFYNLARRLRIIAYHTKTYLMKKLYLFVVLAAAVGTESFSQNFYINPEIGYSFGTGRQNIDDYYFDGTSESASQLVYSLGQGFNFGAGFGYMFNDNIGVELGVNYLMGSKSDYSVLDSDGVTNISLKGNMLRFTPAFVLMLDGESVRPYSKVGLVLGTGKVTSESSSTFSSSEAKQKVELTGNLAPGFSASVGMLFPLNDRIELFGEFNFISMSYAPQKGKMVEATVGGQDVLENLSTSEKEVEFVDSYFISNVSNEDRNSPTKDLKQYLPFSNVGLRAGVRINL
jgi:opacity protein-like surface antigen